MDELIDYYLTNSSVDLVEIALERLVVNTTPSNYLSVISKIEKHSSATELDLSMYIIEIAQPSYIDLVTIIHKKLITFKDIDAIDDLKNALQKINQDKSKT